MPKILEERGGHLPHRDYIAQVVTDLEAIGRGPDSWRLEEEDPAGAPALQAVLGWGAGNHDPYGDPDASDTDCLLTVHWDSTAGWTYVFERESDPDGYPPMELDIPVASDPAGLARALEYVMDSETAGRMLYPVRWEGAERLDQAVQARRTTPLSPRDPAALRPAEAVGQDGRRERAACCISASHRCRRPEASSRRICSSACSRTR
ncbi:hypothetical protein ACFWNL_36645 [Kitasatospora sp. NPDC058397]|uniref:hypothetical protein n=1 Tax=unclassified Kitasatospora TaxID=2633591 RepID=UPI00364ECAF8